MDFIFKQIIEGLKYGVPLIVIYITIRNDFRKRKSEVYKGELKYILNESITFITNLITIKGMPEDNNQEEIVEMTLDFMKDMDRRILLFGSRESVRICACINQISFSGEEEDDFKFIVLTIILICQLKSDIVGEKTNPSLVYRVFFRDANEIVKRYKTYNNKIVNQLKLKNFLKI